MKLFTKMRQDTKSSQVMENKEKQLQQPLT